jgi:hypothetical protein
VTDCLENIDLKSLAEEWAGDLDRTDFYRANAALMAAFLASAGKNRQIMTEVEMKSACALHPDWQAWRRTELEKYLHDARETLVSVIDFEAVEDGDEVHLPISRSLHVSSDWHRKEALERPLGLCWSWDSEAAFPWDAQTVKDGMTITISGLVTLEDIDWKATLIQAALGCVSDDEREIRVKDSAMVTVEAVYQRFRHGTDWVKLDAPELTGTVLPAGTTEQDPGALRDDPGTPCPGSPW